MNFWQGLAIGFLAGSFFVMFALPWLKAKNGWLQQEWDEMSKGADIDSQRALDRETLRVLTIQNIEYHDHIRDLEEALKPFALNPGAVSLTKALGHISREHLLAAHEVLKP